MSYVIRLYRAEVKDRHAAVSSSAEFFDDARNFKPFNKHQFKGLKEQLIQYGYHVENEDDNEVCFGFIHDGAIEVLLTTNYLTFTSGFDGIFEINTRASELTKTGEFKKYNPQIGNWE